MQHSVRHKAYVLHYKSGSDNDNYLTGEFTDVDSGEPYDIENELIDHGVYCYAITH